MFEFAAIMAGVLGSVAFNLAINLVKPTGFVQTFCMAIGLGGTLAVVINVLQPTGLAQYAFVLLVVCGAMVIGSAMYKSYQARVTR